MAKDSLAELENTNYLARFDDGLLDMFIGVSLLWIGAAWMWFEDLAGFAGLLPAVLATPFASLRGRFLRNRGGYVRFSESRRGWERRNLRAFLAVGVAVAGLVMILVLVDPGATRDAAQWLAPGVIGLFVAAMLGLLAAVSRLPRLAWYTVLLVLASLGAAALATNPGAPLLLSGSIITACALVLVSRYLKAHPGPAAP
jgi:hypothetical protein